VALAAAEQQVAAVPGVVDHVRPKLRQVQLETLDNEQGSVLLTHFFIVFCNFLRFLSIFDYFCQFLTIFVNFGCFGGNFG
jgi:hypothetical protein